MLTDVPRPVRPWPALVVASLASFMVFLDTQVLFVAFDDIRASFPTVSVAAMSWTLSAYTIALAAALVPAGRMADRFGRRRTFMIGLAVFTVASLLCALAPTPAALVASGCCRPSGAAALIPSALALVLTVFPPERVPVAVAIWGSISALSAAVGPTVGALLVQQWDWRAVFLANLPSASSPWPWRRDCCRSRASTPGVRSPTRWASSSWRAPSPSSPSASSRASSGTGGHVRTVGAIVLGLACWARSYAVPPPRRRRRST